jgi:broad-specificity NMP kinase
VLAIAPHVDPMLLDLFAALRGNGVRRGIDLALVGEMFCCTRADRVELLRTLDPQRPLVRWGLLDVRSDLPPAHRELHANLDVVGHVCGVSSLARHLTVARSDASLSDLALAQDLRERLEGLALAWRDATPAPWIVAWGRRGTGKATIASRLAAYTGRSVIGFEPVREEGPHAARVLAAQLVIAQREALIRDAVLYVGPVAPGPVLDEIVRRLRDFPGRVALGVETTTPPRLAYAPSIEEIALPVPDEKLQRELWAKRVPDDGWQLAISRAYKLTPGEIMAVADEVNAQASSRKRAATRADVRAGIERRLRSELSDMATRAELTATWDDVILPPADHVRLRELIARTRHAEQVYGAWLGGRIGYGKGTVALFSGPPGTGKTMLAGLIATTLEMDLYQVDLSQVVSKWVGETEKQLARLFDLAERTHAVLLFDEADSLLGKRTDVESSNDRFANTTVNFLLQRLERYRGIAILTTNKPNALDEALVRRLALHLRLEIPEAPDRLRLWRSFLSPRIPGSEVLDLEWTAEAFELSGGHIKNAAVRLAFLAADAGTPASMPMLIDAIEAELDDIGRVVHATTFDRSRRDPLEVVPY